MTNIVEFTETYYRKLIKKISNHYKFEVYSRVGCEHPHVLWRHDIDMSPHRAAKLAEIEMQENVISTYFLHLHSAFYNLFDESVAQKIYRIIECGHPIGLHYDLEFYRKLPQHTNQIDLISFEKSFLWDVFGVKPMAISFHNPSLSVLEIPSVDKIVGMINADSDYIRGFYKFFSDSNCEWKYGNPEDFIGDCKYLHVLTHPEWWTLILQTHGEKVRRCVSGRYDYSFKYYNNIIEQVKRHE